jgi:hypothetical protein
MKIQHQRISGSAVDGAPTEEPPGPADANEQRERGDNDPPWSERGQLACWRVPCSCMLCWMEHPRLPADISTRAPVIHPVRVHK